MIKKIKILFLVIFLAFSPMVLEAKIYDDVYVAQKQALKEAKLMIFLWFQTLANIVTSS